MSDDDYLPAWATADEACAWLSRAVGGTWNLPRLIEHAVWPSVWLDWNPDLPPELFGDRREGFRAEFVFAGDTQRLAFDRAALMTMTRRPSDGLFVRFAQGVEVPVADLRFPRDFVKRAARRVLEIRAEQGRAPIPDEFLRAELWSLREAAYLLSAQAPRSEQAFRTEDREAGGAVGLAYRGLKDAAIAGTLRFLEVDGTYDRRRVKPADAVAWAMGRGMAVPEALRVLAGTDKQAEPQNNPAAPGAGDGDAGITPQPLTTRDLASAFSSIETRDAEGWAKLLGNPRKCLWAHGARVTPGTRGKVAATWNPVAFAALLEQRGVTRAALKACFRKSAVLAPWRAAWGSRIAELEALGLDKDDRPSR